MNGGNILDVTCDECRRIFVPDLLEQPLPCGGAVQQFTCPGCGHLYRVARITAKGLALRGKLVDALAEGDLVRADAIRKKYRLEVETESGQR